MITPPEAGEPVDELWRTVAELTKVVNALSNMKVVVTTTAPRTGTLEIQGESSTLMLIG